MISVGAAWALEQMLEQGLKAALRADAADALSMTELTDTVQITTQRIVVLSVSSYAFRLVVMIHFTPDEATRAHFARINRLAPEAMDNQVFTDAINECGNVCCGTINRDLARTFRHVGMSTPNTLDRQCLRYLSKLGGSHERHFAIDTPGGASFFASLCMTAFERLDFDVDTQADESSGELEMF